MHKKKEIVPCLKLKREKREFISSINKTQTLAGNMKGVQSPRENAQFLMANTALKGFAGFLFWILVARFYSAEEFSLESPISRQTSQLFLFPLHFYAA
ncbi:MAG: hypothetical protein DSO00_02385 [Archaeoglobi archaeon]|nr:MAG: hypothetical protein DSO00_02385 [Archaeoglobi archaeon]